ncbi:MAG: hypothetical protein FWC29_06225 [Methanomassiliicoccaceae archaeon]|nr:hypothetical protein [Methanomassiliicoccaceae archaeon]
MERIIIGGRRKLAFALLIAMMACFIAAITTILLIKLNVFAFIPLLLLISKIFSRGVSPAQRSIEN